FDKILALKMNYNMLLKIGALQTLRFKNQKSRMLNFENSQRWFLQKIQRTIHQDSIIIPSKHHKILMHTLEKTADSISHQEQDNLYIRTKRNLDFLYLFRKNGDRNDPSTEYD
ncbi:unnamed protein product, partial [Owenia fusiformis]